MKLSQIERLKQKHPLSTYTDDEKRWLVTTADEEQSKSSGFMLGLKQRWDEQYPEKNHVSKQNLRDNASRFKEELEMNVRSEKAQIEIEEDTTLKSTHKWTTEMKVNLLKIEERERNRDRGFMKRIKEAWDDIYENSTISAQTLRDNAARFRKDNSLLNLITVRDGNDVEPEAINIRAIEPVRCQENVEENENEEEIIENINGEEEEETRIMRLRFEKILQTLKASTKENIEGRERLMKLKKGVAKAEIDRANKILEKHLGNTNNICTVIDAVYAMGQTIEERKGVKRNEKRKENKNQEGPPNRRIRKLEKQIKELRQILAWTSNEIHRRKIKRKSTKKEKEILQKLKKWADQQLNRNEELICVKEKALDKFRYCNIKMKQLKIKDVRIRNNKMFQEDQGMFHKRHKGRSS